MPFLSRVISSTRNLLQKRERDNDLEAEIRSQLELLTDQKIKEGLPPDEARRAAKIELGGVEQLKEQVRAVRTGAWLDSLLQDIRFALRMLRKNPAFTVVAILTLALGIGANTAVFSVAYGILLRPLPFSHPDRIVQIWGRTGRMERSSVYISLRDFRAIQQDDRLFAQIGAYLEGGCCDISSDDGTTTVQGARVSGNFFTVLGAQPLLGRPILPEDDRPGNEKVAVINYPFWRQFFGGDPQIIGKQVSISRNSTVRTPKPYTIVGVMPAKFPFPNLGKIFVPDVTWDSERQAIGIARLKDGISISQANAELQSIAANLQAEYPNTEPWLSLSVDTLRSRITKNSSTGLLVLLGAVGFVLLLSCTNISSLLIARCWSRGGEISVRHALGATRPRLVRQLLVESGLLALFGGLLGLFAASWIVSFLRAIAPPGTPRLDEIVLDWHVFSYALGVSLICGLLFGLLPALLVSKIGPSAGLKEMHAGSFGTSASRKPRVLRSALIVAEISLTFVLVTGSVLTLRSLFRLSNVDLGFTRNNVVQMWVSLTRATCSTQATCNNAQREILDRVSSLPGVKGAAFGVWQPLTSPFMGHFELRGSSKPQQAQYQAVTPAYFDVLGIPLLKGRAFSDADTPSSPSVVIVDKGMAETFFKGDALGRQISIAKDKKGNALWSDIVGEVGDTRDSSPARAPSPAYYVPYAQDTQSFMSERSLIVRTTSDPAVLLPSIQREVWAVDKNAPIPGAESIKQLLAEKTAEPRFQTSLLAAFGVIALVLAIVGIYGVTSYSLAQRTHEIGVRVALGARPRDIIRLVLGEGAVIAVIGIIIGTVAAAGLTRYLRSLLFEIKPLDVVTFVGVALALGATALLAYYIPARRAMRVDPMIALRHE